MSHLHSVSTKFLPTSSINFKTATAIVMDEVCYYRISAMRWKTLKPPIEYHFTPVRLLLLIFFCKLNAVFFYFQMLNVDIRRGFTYLRIPGFLFIFWYTDFYTDFGVIIWLLIHFALILLLATVRTIKILDCFRKMLEFL